MRLARLHDVDLDPATAEGVIRGLEEIGLLVPGHKVEERVEQLAQERLQALKAERGR